MTKPILGFFLLSSSVSLLGQAPPTPAPGAIRFEDATAKSGIQFTHSFGARALGSLLEGTGSGCVWFDYNNDGLLDLYVTSGKPLEDGMHPYPLKQPPATPPHNHLYRNNGDGTFTDVTEQAGVAANLYGMAAIAADFDNDGFVDLFVTGYGKAILYHNNGDGTFTDVTAKAGIKVDGWSISSAWLDYDRDGCVDLVCRPLCEVRSQVPQLLPRRQLSWPARLCRRHQPPLSQQLRRNLH
jgi:enediyne biosynthesis protein E4